MEETIDIEQPYKLCKRGHVRSPENSYKNGVCKFCQNISSNNWAQKNKEKISERQRFWARQNKEKRQETSRRWKEENKEKASEYRKMWDKKHPEKHRIYNKKHDDNNREIIREKQRNKVVNLHDSYVKGILRMRYSGEITPELIDLKREQLLFQRAYKDLVIEIKKQKEIQG